MPRSCAVRHAGGDPAEERRGPAGGDDRFGPKPAEEIGERATFAKLHRDIANSSAVVRVIHANDVRMVEPGKGNCIRQEPISFRRRSQNVR